jgi:hypothetical protein
MDLELNGKGVTWWKSNDANPLINLAPGEEASFSCVFVVPSKPNLLANELGVGLRSLLHFALGLAGCGQHALNGCSGKMILRYIARALPLASACGRVGCAFKFRRLP